MISQVSALSALFRMIIYTLADYLEKQDDIKLIKKKDYIAIRSRMATAAFI